MSYLDMRWALGIEQPALLAPQKTQQFSSKRQIVHLSKQAQRFILRSSNQRFILLLNLVKIFFNVTRNLFWHAKCFALKAVVQ
uniref:Uncharacterized protein n=1 Tax=Picea sitchensis TaxID=3332 RepID=A9P0J7_PICSI|nr:unknown [Picea sitchensis]